MCELCPWAMDQGTCRSTMVQRPWSALGSLELMLQTTLAWVGAHRDALKMKRRSGRFSLIEAVGGRAAMVAR
jgi:hypothetical protein